MKSFALAQRNFKETWLDLTSLGLVVILPPLLFVIIRSLGALNSSHPFFTPANIAPGIVVFGFALISLGAGMLLTKDRETAFLTRLMTAPLRARDFIMAYALPYIPVVIIQFVIVYVLAAIFGMEITAAVLPVFLILFIMSIGYIGLGLILGTTCTYKSVSAAWLIVNLATIFSGALFSMDSISGGIKTVLGVLPFSHALEAARAVAVNGASFGDILTDLYWVIGYTIAFLAIGVYLFKRKMTD